MVKRRVLASYLQVPSVPLTRLGIWKLNELNELRADAKSKAAQLASSKKKLGLSPNSRVEDNESSAKCTDVQHTALKGLVKDRAEAIRKVILVRNALRLASSGLPTKAR